MSDALDRCLAILGDGGRGALVDRVVALLAQPEGGRVLVIAPNEVVARDLARRIIAGHGRPDARLEVGTVPGVCGGLLQRAGLAADLRSPQRRREAAAAAFAEWQRGFARRHPEAASVVMAVGSRALGRAARALARHPDLSAHMGPSIVDWAGLRRRLAAVHLELRHQAGRNRAPDPLLERNEAVLDALEAAVAQADARSAVLRALDGEAMGDRRRGRASAWHGDGMERFLRGIEAWQRWLTEARAAWLGATHARVIEDMQRHLLPELPGGEDPPDHLIEVVALARRPEACARLRHGLRALVLAAAEEASAELAELAILLTRPPLAAGPWGRTAPEAGRLVIAADLCQALSVDEEPARRLLSLVAQTGSVTRIEANPRATGLAAWLDHSFATLPGYTARPATRAEVIDPVVLLPEADDPVDALARHLRSSVDAGVFEPGEVLVLLAAWTEADEVAARLNAAGLPALVDGARALADRDEVRLALAGLTAVEWPEDGEAVVATLRGLFGITPAELAAFASTGGRWNYLDADVAPDSPVGAAYVSLRRLHGRRGEPWSVVLAALLAETEAEAVWALGPRAPGAFANLDRLRAVLDEADAEAVDSAAALTWARRRARGLREPSTTAPGHLRVTTLAEAKGREARVVALLHMRRRLEAPTVIADRLGGGVAVQAGRLVPPDWAALQARWRARRAEAMRRWIYLGATRATDQLVVVRHPEDHLLEADLLRGLAPALRAAHDAVVEVAPGARVRVRHRAALPPTTTAITAFPGRDAAVVAALAGPEPPAREPTLVGAPPGRPRPPPTRSAAERIEAATRAGLAHLDLMAPEEALEVLPGLARWVAADLLEADQSAVVGLMRRVLEHPALSRARAAAVCWQAVSFAHPTAGGVVAGSLPLCFSEARGGHWVVVDCAAAPAPPGSAAESMARRRIAAAAGEALASLGRCDAVEVVLVGP